MKLEIPAGWSCRFMPLDVMLHAVSQRCSAHHHTSPTYHQPQQGAVGRVEIPIFQVAAWRTSGHRALACDWISTWTVHGTWIPWDRTKWPGWNRKYSMQSESGPSLQTISNSTWDFVQGPCTNCAHGKQGVPSYPLPRITPSQGNHWFQSRVKKPHCRHALLIRPRPDAWLWWAWRSKQFSLITGPHRHRGHMRAFGYCRLRNSADAPSSRFAACWRSNCCSMRKTCTRWRTTNYFKWQHSLPAWAQILEQSDWPSRRSWFQSL